MSLEVSVSEPLVEQKKKNPNTVYGILCVIGSCIMRFIFPSIFSFHTFCIYQVSYIKHNGGDAEVIYSMFYYPVTLLFQSIFGLFAGIIFAKVGVHWSNLIGTAIFLLAGFLMYISKRFFLDMISEALFGIGTSIIAFPTVINACHYFMNHIGLVNGIIETFSALGTTFFTYLGEQMINPEGIPSNPQDHLYKEEVANRVKTFELLQILTALGAYVITEIMTKTYDENNKEQCSIKFLFRINEIKSLCKKKNDPIALEEEKVNIENIQSIVSRDKSTVNTLNKIENEPSNAISKAKKTRKEKIKIALKSWKFWKYNLISLSCSPIGNTIFSLYRSIGETYQVNQTVLQLLGTLSFIIQFIVSFIFGVLCDYVNFQVLLFICNILGTIVGLMYYNSFHYSIIFLLLTLLLSVQSAAFVSLKDYHLMKVFGTEIYIDLSGVINLTAGIFVIFLTVMVYFIETLVEDKDMAYSIIFPVFGLVNFIGVILGYFLDNKPLDYGE